MKVHAWEYFTNQKQWESYLKDLLVRSNKALFRAIVLIYDNQTNEEKNKGQSIENNNIGFSKIDAYELGYMAKKIKAGRGLTQKELTAARYKMPKYWKQLMNISKAKLKKEHDACKADTSYECPCSYGICDECPLYTSL